jgi:DNA-binding MarR family transcriptional regulator
MEERGLVERHDSPTDRRVVEVHIGARAQELSDAAKARRRDHLREILARVDERRLEGLLEGLRAVRAARAELEQEHDHGVEGLVRVHVRSSGAGA